MSQALPACTAALLMGAVFAGCSRDNALPTEAVTSFASVSGDASPPDPPFIFLHYDYIVSPEGGLFPGDTVKDYSPDPAAIDRVVKAFRHHGITLVIDPQHTAIPWHSLGMGFTGCPNNPPRPDCANVFDLKAQYFRPKGNLPWHYGIFGGIGFNGGQRSSGAAEMPGYTFMVTLIPPQQTCTFGSQVDLCQDRQSGWLMHELGHNLGLDHGGDEPENYKPNYISVMNYAFNRGFLYTLQGDSYEFAPFFSSPSLADLAHIAGIRLDYSDGSLPAIDERHLDERVGLGGLAANTGVSSYVGNDFMDCSGYDFRTTYLHASAGPLDWNHNGQIESDVAVDVNWTWTWTLAGEPFPPINVCPVFSILHDYDDWAHVQRFLGMPEYLTAKVRPRSIMIDPLEP